jgi:hypothetical protein
MKKSGIYSLDILQAENSNYQPGILPDCYSIGF